MGERNTSIRKPKEGRNVVQFVMFIFYIITHRLFFSSSVSSPDGVCNGDCSGLMGVVPSTLGRLNSPCATMSMDGRSGFIGAFVTHAPGKRVDAVDRVDSRRLRIVGGEYGSKSELLMPYSGTVIKGVMGPELTTGKTVD